MRPALALLLLALPLAGCSSEEPPADPALVATEVGGGIVNATAAPAEPRRLEVLWDGEVPLSAGPCWPYTPPECLDATGIDDERRLWPFAGRAAGGAVTVTWTPNSTLSTELRAVAFACGGGQEECQVVGEAQGPSPLRLEIAAAEAGRISGVLRVESLHAAPAASPALLVSPSQAFRAEGFVLVGPAA